MGSVLTLCMRIDVVDDRKEDKKVVDDRKEDKKVVDDRKEDKKPIKKTLHQCTLENTKPVMYKFNKAKVIKVYDGDTITIAALHDGDFCRFNVRIFGVDCDEIKGGTAETKSNAQLAKRYVSALVLNKIVDIKVMNDVHEKFGRLLAKISIDGVSVSDKLLEMGLARPYDGGKKDDIPLQPSLYLELEIKRLSGEEIND